MHNIEQFLLKNVRAKGEKKARPVKEREVTCSTPNTQLPKEIGMWARLGQSNVQPIVHNNLRLMKVYTSPLHTKIFNLSFAVLRTLGHGRCSHSPTNFIIPLYINSAFTRSSFYLKH